MINNTNTFTIDGNIIDHDDITNAFKVDKSDKFTRWVVRPLALLAGLGMAVAVFFASAFMIMLSLAMLPLLAVAMWAMKTRLAREAANAEPTVATQE